MVLALVGYSGFRVWGVEVLMSRNNCRDLRRGVYASGWARVACTKGGTVRAGDWGVAFAGDWGTAVAGYNGYATAGDLGTAISGERGTARVGYRGKAMAGAYGQIQVKWYSAGSRIRTAVGYVGEGGILPDTFYQVKGEGELVPALVTDAPRVR